ncbi:FAD binding protein [Aureococcus anophagefferens]|nr:FAD binding protein [Aureococcus anophagefferens]
MARVLAAVALLATTHALVAPTTHTTRVAPSRAVADLLKDAKLDIPWLAEGDAPAENKVNTPESAKRIFALPDAPVRHAESPERVAAVRARAATAAKDAAELRGMLTGAADSDAWWRSPPPGGAGSERELTEDEPLRVLVAGGGLAGLVTAAACHAKGMKVALFEQASSYAPYGGPIQIQSNALRAIERINKDVYDELVAAGTVTADRVSGLKIGYKRGNKLAGLYDKGDWLVRFDTLGPALEAGLPATVVVDRPVIQQIFVKHGFPEETVRIASRVVDYGDEGGCVKAVLEDGTVAYGDVLVGATASGRPCEDHARPRRGRDGGRGVGRRGRRVGRRGGAGHGAGDGAPRTGRSAAGFTRYAALADIRASNIEEVSYQILLGDKKYFVSTDGGGERQQWFALIREPPGGVDPEPTAENPTPKLDRLRREFADGNVYAADADGKVWDGFALSSPRRRRCDIKRRDLYDGAPLDNLDLKRWWSPGPTAASPSAATPRTP